MLLLLLLFWNMNCNPSQWENRFHSIYRFSQKMKIETETKSFKRIAFSKNAHTQTIGLRFMSFPLKSRHTMLRSHRIALILWAHSEISSFNLSGKKWIELSACDCLFNRMHSLIFLISKREHAKLKCYSILTGYVRMAEQKKIDSSWWIISILFIDSVLDCVCDGFGTDFSGFLIECWKTLITI